MTYNPIFIYKTVLHCFCRILRSFDQDKLGRTTYYLDRRSYKLRKLVYFQIKENLSLKKGELIFNEGPIVKHYSSLFVQVKENLGSDPWACTLRRQVIVVLW